MFDVIPNIIETETLESERVDFVDMYCRPEAWDLSMSRKDHALNLILEISLYLGDY